MTRRRLLIAVLFALLLPAVSTGQEATPVAERFAELAHRAESWFGPQAHLAKDELRAVRRELASFPREELTDDDWIDFHCVLLGIDRFLDPAPPWSREAAPSSSILDAIPVEPTPDPVALIDAALRMRAIRPAPGTAPPRGKEVRAYGVAARKASGLAKGMDAYADRGDVLVEAAAEIAAEAARELAFDLRARSKGRVPVGRERFEWTLSRIHGLDRTVEEVRRIGERAIARCLGDLSAYAARVGGGRTWQQMVELSRDNHPDDDAELLAFLELATAEAVDAAASSGLVTVPGYASRPGVAIGPSPPVVPYAHYRRGKTDRDGIFRGTAHYSRLSRLLTEEEQREWRRERDRHTLRVICGHEAVPGHHLQYAVASRIERPLRRAGYNSSYVEGWALHSEEILDRAGYFRDPLTRVAFLRMRLWRAVRIVLDVGLHTGEVSPTEAVEMLSSVALLGRVGARGEVNRYLGSPTQPLSYLTGAERIRVMRRAYLARHGPDSEREFNDRLLGLGPVPLDLAAAALLGKRRAYDAAHP